MRRDAQCKTYRFHLDHIADVRNLDIMICPQLLKGTMSKNIHVAVTKLCWGTKPSSSCGRQSWYTRRSDQVQRLVCRSGYPILLIAAAIGRITNSPTGRPGHSNPQPHLHFTTQPNPQVTPPEQCTPVISGCEDQRERGMQAHSSLLQVKQIP